MLVSELMELLSAMPDTAHVAVGGLGIRGGLEIDGIDYAGGNVYVCVDFDVPVAPPPSPQPSRTPARLRLVTSTATSADDAGGR